MEELLNKLRDGTLDKDGALRLLQLIKNLNADLSKEDQILLNALLDKYGLRSQEERDREEFNSLLQKLRDGTLSEEELNRLKNLIHTLDITLSDSDASLLSALERHFADLATLASLRTSLHSETITSTDLDRLESLASSLRVTLTEEEQALIDKLRAKWALEKE